MTRRKYTNGGPIAIFLFPIFSQCYPALNRPVQGIRKMMLAKTSLGVYANLSLSGRRCRAARLQQVTFFECIGDFLISYFGCSHLVGPELLIPPDRSSTELTVKIFRIADYSVREATCFTFFIPFFVYWKPSSHPAHIHCHSQDQIGHKSRQFNHMICISM